MLGCVTAGPGVWAPAPLLGTSLWYTSGLSPHVSLPWKTGMQMGDYKDRADPAQALPSQPGNSQGMDPLLEFRTDPVTH